MIQNYLKAGYPAMLLLTQEPHRAETILPCEGWTFLAWDCLRGFRQAGKPQTIEEIRDPVEAVNRLGDMQDTVLLAHNLHLFLEIPEVIQAIQNGITKWKSTGSCLVTISPSVQMRPEIEKIFTVIDLPLPDEKELFRMQSDLAASLGVEPSLETARTAKGLTEFEAETAFALSLIKNGSFSTRVITEAKAQMIRKSGLMEFWEPAHIEDVGGLENLKAYIRNRAKAFLPGNEHLPRPKGILLVGISGTGKSLSCKATASILGWPLIRLDIGNLKNSLIGESERRMRQATQMIDAFGEAVIWLDELEKMFAGSKSSGETDAGTTAGMFGHFLSWMAETKSSALVMATANDISKLPPEFVRAGRFDAIFFVDLPGRVEREEIIGIMNLNYHSRIPGDYAPRLSGFTGAEIEQLAKDSLFDGLDAASENIVPLSKTMREDITALREWAKTRARLANTPEEEPTEQRKIRALN
jgi:AAA+ superfamily predicted ATPase